MCPFQAEILKGKVVRAPTQDTHLMVAPIWCTDVESRKAHPLSPGLQVLHAYTMLKAGCKHVTIVI